MKISKEDLADLQKRYDLKRPILHKECGAMLAHIERLARVIEAKDAVVDACLAWIDSPPMTPSMTNDEVRMRLREDEKIYNALHDTVAAYKAASETTENTEEK